MDPLSRTSHPRRCARRRQRARLLTLALIVLVVTGAGIATALATTRAGASGAPAAKPVATTSKPRAAIAAAATAPARVSAAASAAAATASALASTATSGASTAVVTETQPAVPSDAQLAAADRSAVTWKGSTVLITGVPAYLWRDGCTPTAFGMVMGYYDGKPGLGFLIPGDASTQTRDVNQSIASHGSPRDPQFYEDYALPRDAGSASAKPDKSTLDPTHVHADDCLADFLKTARSSLHLRYGSSRYLFYAQAFHNYVAFRQGGTGPYVGLMTRNPWRTQRAMASLLKAQIRLGRPMVFSVDSNGDGVNDHTVPVIGYRVFQGHLQYACYDTWKRSVHWAFFRRVGSVFGVKTMYTTSIEASGQTP
jgi:hypothetical protein